MRAETFVEVARRKDKEGNIDPWQFAESNPGFVWLVEKQEAFLDEDAAYDPNVASKSVSAGSVSSSKSFLQRSAKARVDIIQDAIDLYKSGVGSLPTKTIGTFGLYSA